jgi:hypothetical protein
LWVRAIQFGFEGIQATGLSPLGGEQSSPGYITLTLDPKPWPVWGA